jgi:hypothetical protein
VYASVLTMQNHEEEKGIPDYLRNVWSY